MVRGSLLRVVLESLIQHVGDHVDGVGVHLETFRGAPGQDGSGSADVTEGEVEWTQDGVDQIFLDSCYGSEECGESGSERSDKASDEGSEDLGDDDGTDDGKEEGEELGDLAQVEEVSSWEDGGFILLGSLIAGGGGILLLGLGGILLCGGSILSGLCILRLGRGSILSSRCILLLGRRSILLRCILLLGGGAILLWGGGAILLGRVDRSFLWGAVGFSARLGGAIGGDRVGGLGDTVLVLVVVVVNTVSQGTGRQGEEDEELHSEGGV
jgi:hypothetical protein